MAQNPLSAPVAVTACECVSACGPTREHLYEALVRNCSVLASIRLFPLPFATVVGEVDMPLPPVPQELEAFDTRNARLGLAALSESLRERVRDAVRRHGSHRIGLVLGTSTSGLLESEAAYAHLLKHGRMPADFSFMSRHAYQATAQCLHVALKLQGPCYAISTACSSSNKALAAAQRLINAGICDAVVAGGVDTLCQLTLRGFHSLELISSQPCAPMDEKRQGINIGEGAGLLLLEKTTPQLQHHPHLLAVGESSDAHHMSTPHPEGEGAGLAMKQALGVAAMASDRIDYINLHATATPLNDTAEAIAVSRCFPHGPPCSGTKGITGHALGAAGAVEAVISLLALERQFMPGTCGLQTQDPDCPCDMLKEPRLDTPLQTVMSNSFGFGGTNASAIFARVP